MAAMPMAARSRSERLVTAAKVADAYRWPVPGCPATVPRGEPGGGGDPGTGRRDDTNCSHNPSGRRPRWGAGAGTHPVSEASIVRSAPPERAGTTEEGRMTAVLEAHGFGKRY